MNMIPVPPTVLSALCAAYAIEAEQLVYLGGGGEQSEGVVYEYVHPVAQADARRVLKIGMLGAADSGGFLRLEERLKFVHFMGENGINIVYPLTRPDGSLFATIRDGENIFVAYTMEKVSGSHPGAEPWDASFVQRLGKTIGQMHALTRRYPTWQCAVMDPVSGKPVLGWEQEWQDFYDWCSDPEVKQHWLVMRQRLQDLPITQDGYGFIHNDPHSENLLVAGETIFLLDFDVANYHWFITDISVAMQSLMFRSAGGMDRPLKDAALLRSFLDVFLLGYETEHHLDAYWLGKIDQFIQYRRMLLFTVMQGWLQKKPRLRARWKEMIFSEPPILNS